jgi:hypothetical protein
VDDVWGRLELHAAFDEPFVLGVDVVDTEVEKRAGCGLFEEQSGAVAEIEERPCTPR